MILITEKIEEEKIRTLHPNGREGVLLFKSVYDTIRNKILSELYRYHYLSSIDLLEKCNQNLQSHPVEISWLILNVKLDLEARGLIKSFVPVGHKAMRHIKLTRLGLDQLPFEYRKNILNKIKLKPTINSR